MDAVVLAGAGKASRLVFGENKAFLLIENRPILNWVMDALCSCQHIEQVAVVGPLERLEKLLSAYSRARILIIDQDKSLYENASRAIYQLFGITKEDELKPQDYDKPVLVLSSDIPLLTSTEVEYFIKHAPLDKYDFIYGVASEATLSKFYPTKSKPGIKPACFHTDKFSGRICNLVLVKPFRLKNRWLLDQVYSLRYQKRLFNILISLLKIIRLFKPGLIWNYILIQLGLQAERLGWKNLSKKAGKKVKLNILLEQISQLLGLRFGIFELPFGGSALDIDNERDYLVFCQRFNEWKNEQEKLAKEFKEKGLL